MLSWHQRVQPLKHKPVEQSESSLFVLQHHQAPLTFWVSIPQDFAQWRADWEHQARYQIIYQACVLDTLHSGSEYWTIYANQKRRLNTFHLLCLRCVLRIEWQDTVPNTKVVQQVSSKSSCTAQLETTQVVGPCSTHAGRISKDNLYGECTLTLNVRCEDSYPVGQSKLRFKGVWKCDTKLTDINLHLPGKASRLSRGLKSCRRRELRG